MKLPSDYSCNESKQYTSDKDKMPHVAVVASYLGIHCLLPYVYLCLFVFLGAKMWHNYHKNYKICNKMH